MMKSRIRRYLSPSSSSSSSSSSSLLSYSHPDCRPYCERVTACDMRVPLTITRIRKPSKTDTSGNKPRDVRFYVCSGFSASVHRHRCTPIHSTRPVLVSSGKVHSTYSRPCTINEQQTCTIVYGVQCLLYTVCKFHNVPENDAGLTWIINPSVLRTGN